MAKLENVKVLSGVERISVDGTEYTKTNEDAKKGDVIRYTDENYDMTTGGFYVVNDIDGCNDPQITDDGGDGFDLYSHAYDTFRKASVITPRLTVGDYAKVVAHGDDHGAEIGDYIKIVEDDGEDTLNFRCTFADGTMIDGPWFDAKHLTKVTKAEALGTKASAKLPDNSVIHDGKAYVKVARGAEAGELIMMSRDDTFGEYVEGDVFTATERSTFVSNTGDIRRYSHDESGSVFTVLVPVEKAPQQYREVKRKATVGERIKIVKAGANIGYRNGDVLTVRDYSTAEWSNVVFAEGVDIAICHKEYVVLEPLTQTEDGRKVTVSDVGKTYTTYSKFAEKHGYPNAALRGRDDKRRMLRNGETVTLVTSGKHEDGDRTLWIVRNDIGDLYIIRDGGLNFETPRLKVGDYAKVIGQSGHYQNGTIVKIVSLNWMGSGKYDTQNLDGTSGDIHSDDKLTPVTAEEVDEAQRKLFVKGDKVRLISGGNRFPLNGYMGGDIYVVRDNDRIHSSGKHGKLVQIGKSLTDGSGFATPVQLEKVTAEELAELERPKLTEGDYVKVIVDTEDLTEGSIGKITSIEWGVPWSHKVKLIDGSASDLFKPHQLERVTEADVKKAEAEAESLRKKSEITAQWAKIGRKVGEFKVGDVVKTLTDTCGHPIGTIGIVEYDAHSLVKLRVRANGKLYSHGGGMELVTPVESVVNLPAQ